MARVTILMAVLAAAPALAAAQSAGTPSSATQAPAGVAAQRARIERELFHELVTLRRYGVFDHLAFKVHSDGVVRLLGAAATPGLRGEAERAAKRIEGIETVRNEIEALPRTVESDRVRRAVFQAVYGGGGLERYAFQAMPPIHILARGGQVTLEGSVATATDKALAATRARGVEGVTTVVDNLVLDAKLAPPTE